MINDADSGRSSRLRRYGVAAAAFIVLLMSSTWLEARTREQVRQRCQREVTMAYQLHQSGSPPGYLSAKAVTNLDALRAAHGYVIKVESVKCAVQVFANAAYCVAKVRRTQGESLEGWAWNGQRVVSIGEEPLTTYSPSN
jgi:hypothetical protein